MLLPVLVLMLSQAASQASAPPAAPSQPAAKPPAAAAQPAPRPDVPLDQQLLGVKRIYVDTFGDDATSKAIQAMVVTSLTESKRFIVTENKEKADAILRGTGLEKTSQEFHSYEEGTAAGSFGGGFSGGSGSFGGGSAAIKDAGASTETIHDARVAVRLVNQDGDVLWASTQESKGAKYKGASADVAEKVVKELVRAVEKLEKKKAAAAPPQS